MWTEDLGSVDKDGLRRLIPMALWFLSGLLIGFIGGFVIAAVCVAIDEDRKDG